MGFFSIPDGKYLEEIVRNSDTIKWNDVSWQFPDSVSLQ